MNKIVMWGVGAVVAGSLAVGFWVSMKTSVPESATAVSAQEETSSGSLADLVSKGATVQCKVTHTSENDTTSGTVYVSGKKVRGDFQSSVTNTGPIESHMITDGEYVYVWSSAMPTGMKMKAQAPEQQANTAPTSSTNPYQQKYDYSCSPWGADASKFELPSGITFSDMSEMMKGVPMPQAGSTGGTVHAPAGMSCATCDKAPAAARAQCRAALGCK